MNQNGSRNYQTQQIMTASPARLVAMLYGKAIVCLKDAIAAIKAGDIEKRWKSNSAAQEIIAHLLSTLDVEKGGEVGQNLEQLYCFMLRQLPQVDFKNDPKVAEGIIGLLEPLARSWEELAEKGGPNSPPPGPYRTGDTRSDGNGNQGEPPLPGPLSISA